MELPVALQTALHESERKFERSVTGSALAAKSLRGWPSGCGSRITKIAAGSLCGS